MEKSALSSSRFGRMLALGWLTGGIAAGVINEGARQLGQGNSPVLSDLLLTPSNMQRITARLSKMRGAAMKVK